MDHVTLCHIPARICQRQQNVPIDLEDKPDMFIVIIPKLIFLTSLVDSLVFINTEDPTWKVPPPKDSTMPNRIPLASLETEVRDSSKDNETSDQEFLDALHSASMRN